MRRLRTDRRRTADLLARPPSGAQELAGGWAAALVDPVEQLEELADLRRRGLLTPEEFERQKLKVWGVD
jgi:Short C-terminal domain